MREAFLAANLEVDIDWLPDGDLVLNRLRSLAPWDGGEPYDLVILDLHLPKRSAKEILAVLESENKKLKMPVVALTTLVSEYDKQALLALGVQEVFLKPSDLDGYFELARRLAALLPGARQSAT